MTWRRGRAPSGWRGILQAMTTDSDRISRLEGIIEQIAATLTALHQGQEDLRSEMREGDAALRAEMRERDAALRAEMTGGDAALRAEMTGGDAALRAEMREGNAALRAEMSGGDAALRAEMREGNAALRAEMHSQFRMVILINAGIWGTVIAGIVAAVVVPIL